MTFNLVPFILALLCGFCMLCTVSADSPWTCVPRTFDQEGYPVWLPSNACSSNRCKLGSCLTPHGKRGLLGEEAPEGHLAKRARPNCKLLNLNDDSQSKFCEYCDMANPHAPPTCAKLGHRREAEDALDDEKRSEADVDA